MSDLSELKIGAIVEFKAFASKERERLYPDRGWTNQSYAVVWKRYEFFNPEPRRGVFLGWTNVSEGVLREFHDGTEYDREFAREKGVRLAVVQVITHNRYTKPWRVFPADIEVK